MACALRNISPSDSGKHLARPTTCLQIGERREKMNEVGAEPLIVMAEPDLNPSEGLPGEDAFALARWLRESPEITLGKGSTGGKTMLFSCCESGIGRREHSLQRRVGHLPHPLRRHVLRR